MKKLALALMVACTPAMAEPAPEKVELEVYTVVYFFDQCTVSSYYSRSDMKTLLNKYTENGKYEVDTTETTAYFYLKKVDNTAIEYGARKIDNVGYCSWLDWTYAAILKVRPHS